MDKATAKQSPATSHEQVQNVSGKFRHSQMKS